MNERRDGPVQDPVSCRDRSLSTAGARAVPPAARPRNNPPTPPPRSPAPSTPREPSRPPNVVPVVKKRENFSGGPGRRWFDQIRSRKRVAAACNVRLNGRKRKKIGRCTVADFIYCRYYLFLVLLLPVSLKSEAGYNQARRPISDKINFKTYTESAT